MKRTCLAATALIASSFTPIALPFAVGVAVAQPTPNVLLCTDTSLLGPGQSGRYWGNPYLLPTQNIVSGTLNAPIPILGGGEHYSGTEAISLQAVVQRCPVMNAAGHPTGQYQDVELTAAHRTTFALECDHTPSTSVPPPYLDCQISHLAGGSPDDR
jgi:hypothetical protein